MSWMSWMWKCDKTHFELKLLYFISCICYLLWCVFVVLKMHCCRASGIIRLNRRLVFFLFLLVFFFQKLRSHFKILGAKRSEVDPVPFWQPTNTRWQFTKCNHHGDEASEISVSLVEDNISDKILLLSFQLYT
jgi:hypothetical protein